MPADYPDYPSHQQILNYFESYAKHFQIEAFIKFNTTVEQVSPTKDNQWLVCYRNELGVHQDVYDYLLVANGHHWDPFIPDYRGQFNGEILHAHQYKKASSFKGKRVLVVGGGNSACDIAVEISRISPKTCISMRRGQHIFPKFIFGKPTDILFAKLRWVPLWLKQFLAKHFIRLWQGRYPKYRLQKPTCKPLETHPTINSELLYFIRHGKISPRQGIERFEENRVFLPMAAVMNSIRLFLQRDTKQAFPFLIKT